MTEAQWQAARKEIRQFARRHTNENIATLQQIAQMGGPAALLQAVAGAGLSMNAVTYLQAELRAVGNSFEGLAQQYSQEIQQEDAAAHRAAIEQMAAANAPQAGDSPGQKLIKQHSPVAKWSTLPATQEKAAALCARLEIKVDPKAGPVRTLLSYAAKNGYEGVGEQLAKTFGTDPATVSRAIRDLEAGAKRDAELTEHAGNLDEFHQRREATAKARKSERDYKRANGSPDAVSEDVSPQHKGRVKYEVSRRAKLETAFDDLDALPSDGEALRRDAGLPESKPEQKSTIASLYDALEARDTQAELDAQATG